MKDAMNTMNIALPDSLKEYVQSRTSTGGYSSVSEYVRELIRADQQVTARQDLEVELLKGLQSGDSQPLTETDWAELREDVRRRHSQRKR